MRRLWDTYPAGALADGGRFWRPEHVRPAAASAGPYRAQGPLPVPVSDAPPVAVLAHHALEPYRLAAAAADRVFVTPTPEHPVEALLAAFGQVAALTADATPTQVLGDIAVVLGDTQTHAEERLRQLNETAGSEWSTDTSIFTGTAEELAHELLAWRDVHGIAGARLRPAVMEEDSARVIRDVGPLLRGSAGGERSS